jgi:hypothetical protein
MHRPSLAGPRRRTRRALLGAALPAALAAAALPAAAQAAADVTALGSEIVVEDRTGKFGSGFESNRLVAESLPGGELRLVDQVGLVAEASGCFQVSQVEVRCVRPSTSPITKLAVRAGGGNDRLTMRGSLPVRYEGGSGDDAYIGGGRPGLPTRVDFSGGGQNGDLADYTLASEGIDVRRDNLGNDGRQALGDTDNIRDDVSIVRGTRFADRLIGDGESLEIVQLLGGDDLVLGAAFPTVTEVDMGSAKDGADRVFGGSGTLVDYRGRTNPIRAAIDEGGADDGEAGEGDELRNVDVTGGRGDDTLIAPDRRADSSGIFFDGGPGNDEISGTLVRDRLIGGPGEDAIGARAGDDTLVADDGEPVDTLFCGLGNDTAETDAAEKVVRDCETRTVIGTLRLAPKAVTAKAGTPAHLRLSWRHPVSWRKLRNVELRLTRADFPAGEITMRPRAERISADGAVELVRQHTRVTHKGKTVTARLALRLDESLVGETLKAEVEATDTRGRRQLELEAGTVRVAK